MPAIPSKALHRVLAFSTAEGATATILVSILGGTFLTALVLQLGASPWQVGLVASLGPLTQVAQIFTAYVVERVESRKRLATWTLLVHRFVWVAAGLLALVLPRGWNLAAFMLLYTVSFCFAAPGVNAWQSLMTDTVPNQVRGRYFGNRWTINTLISMGALLLAGWLVDHLPGAGGFAAIYILGLVVSLVNWYFLTELPEIPQEHARHSYWEHMRSPFYDGRFRTALLWLPLWTLVQLALPPFYTVLMAERMQLSYSLISILTAMTSLASAASFSLWGKLIDRRGPFRLAAPAALFAASVPLLWLLAEQVGVWYLFPLHALLGVSTAALQTLTLQMNMQLAPPQQRAVFIAIMNGANGLAGFVGPLLAGVLAEAGQFSLLFALAGGAGLLLAGLWQLRFLRVMTKAQA